MSDEKKLSVFGTIKDGFNIGVKNIFQLFINHVLWFFTIWIPYINIGTTIGLITGIVVKASKDEKISMVEIFNAKYRKCIREYFNIFPSMDLTISRIYALKLVFLLLVDKGKHPTDAIQISNNCTNGYKLKMFVIEIATNILFVSILTIFILLIVLLFRNYTDEKIIIPISILTFVVIFAMYLFFLFVCIGIKASIYKKLTKDVE